eukprot:TRINITY_DN27747_c0_g1_i1.p2 TRINITY_DN27747_c0_g1~~TRINITY_DN27747_c0_g1_i1.p2  ORF type:complete len:336 (+),score=89.09 TRINITY_DN27747_c0_g1_i1:43-1050(+)
MYGGYPALPRPLDASGHPVWSDHGLSSAEDDDPPSLDSVSTPRARAPPRPWHPAGEPEDRAVPLAEELRAVHAHLVLSDEETARRTYKVKQALGAALAPVWPKADVVVYGSYAFNAALRTSAVDVVVEKCGDVEHILDVLARLNPSECVVDDLTKGGRTGAAKLRFVKGGFRAAVAFVPGRSSGRHAAKQIGALLAHRPAVREAFTIARVLALQVRCADPTTGGVSSYALLQMVIAGLAAAPAGDQDAAAVLTRCFARFGHVRVTAADEAVTSLVVPDALAGGALHVRGSRLPRLLALFKNSEYLLEKQLTRCTPTPLLGVVDPYGAAFAACPRG